MSVTSKPCKDCGKPGRPAPHPGPRCATHHRAIVKVRKARERDGRILRLYGVTPEESAAPLSKARQPDLDHDHKCPICKGSDKACGQCARGFVHGKCNRFIAWIEDNIGSASTMAQYLADPPLKRMREGR